MAEQDIKQKGECAECNNFLLTPRMHNTPSAVTVTQTGIYDDKPGKICSNCGLIHPVPYFLSKNKKRVVIKSICKKNQIPFAEISRYLNMEQCRQVRCMREFVDFLLDIFSEYKETHKSLESLVIRLVGVPAEE